ncbi:transaldolase family protein [Pseudomonas sp. NPDC090202]|uniref:transaldolase family protein n=1 Tax=unclassified Pseudomonas TaxID=196821 RepID=UPI0038076432
MSDYQPERVGIIARMFPGPSSPHPGNRQKDLLMDVPGFARLLKQHTVDSEVWWDSSPALYGDYKTKLIQQYPDMFDAIESLLPDNFIGALSGISGATTNPGLISRAIVEQPRQWQSYIDTLPTGLSCQDKARDVYDRAIRLGAAQLRPLWITSQQRCGWLSAQVENGHAMRAEDIVARGLQLAALAPNVMVKVPGSEQGYQAMEQLVSWGCSVNNTFCFTVSQFSAGLRAVHNGRLRARIHGIDTDKARYVISYMIGRLGAESAFADQARTRRLRLTDDDRRWGELAVYQAMQAMLRRSQTPARLLLCSLKVDTDAQGREHCWHLQRTGADTTLYTMTPQIIEFLIRRQQCKRPILPALDWVQVPKRIMNRLMAIPYFTQAYFDGELPPASFAGHPAFRTAGYDASLGQHRLLDFIESADAGPVAAVAAPRAQAMAGGVR